MQNYHVRLQSEVSKTFRCTRAANSLDIDVEKKSIHELKISADLESEFSIGLILGASGSGKTTLAKQIFFEDCFKIDIDPDKPIIDQLPSDLTYDQCAEILSGIGLTSVPCWIRPIKTLSNGQRSRAEAALQMTKSNDTVVIDEWTSVVDRTVAKVMSHCVQKFARRNKKKIILLSCHYDVVEWLNPDWIIDCNEQKFIDRRLLPEDERRRKEQLRFEIREVKRSCWPFFSRYHYLSDTMPPNTKACYGLFQNENQIGFICFTNYTPIRKGSRPIYHWNRLVIHPDYAGLGLGLRFANETCFLFQKKMNGFVTIMTKFSSQPVLRSCLKDKKHWALHAVSTMKGRDKSADHLMRNGAGARSFVKTYSFRFVGSST